MSLHPIKRWFDLVRLIAARDLRGMPSTFGSFLVSFYVLLAAVTASFVLYTFAFPPTGVSEEVQMGIFTWAGGAFSLVTLLTIEFGAVVAAITAAFALFHAAFICWQEKKGADAQGRIATLSGATHD